MACSIRQRILARVNGTYPVIVLACLIGPVRACLLPLFAFSPFRPYSVNCHSQDAMLLANCIVPASVHAASQRYVPAG